MVAAEYRVGFRIHLVFDDGREKTVDFQRFILEAGTIGWPNGADIAPETLYEAEAVNEAA